jgi:hypothetical protein
MADRLLRHPVPYINESIGNYVLRLCSENSCEVNQISDLIGFKLRGIGHYYRKLNEENITKFSELTGIEIKVIENMTTNRFSFDMYSDFSCHTEAYVCPICYRERSYERIHWKNRLIKVCLDHEIYLVDECPHCKEKISSDIVFLGKCNCGLHIIDFNYFKCVNEYVLHGQNILYQIFNIRSSVPLIVCDLLFNTLSRVDYCNLLSHLQYLTELYTDGLNDLEIFFDNDDGFKSYIIASWIMVDWPTNLIKFLNILNCLDINYINRSSFEVDNQSAYSESYMDVIKDRYMRIFNPLECLKLRGKSRIVFGYEEIYQPIMNYYNENSNIENVKIKMNKYIYLNNYVELDIAIRIFFDICDLDRDIRIFVIKYFHIYKYFNKEYLDIEEIFDFYNKIKKKCSITFSDIKGKSDNYSTFLILFQHFGITISDIIYVQMNSESSVRFDPITFHGIATIFYQYNQIKKELLLLLAERIDVLDSFK